MGQQFTVADAYLHTLLNWTGPLKVDLTKFPALQEYQARIAARPAVQAAQKAEHGSK
jgi:glutathione S-transferase